MELGARHVEFDVQLSADRQPMLLNDSNLKRTAGVDRNALEMTWHELAKCGHRAGTFRSTTPTSAFRLGQAVDLLATHPAMTAFVEIKRASLRTFGHEIVVRKVCEVLKPVVRQCVLVSADLQPCTTCGRFRRIASAGCCRSTRICRR